MHQGSNRHGSLAVGVIAGVLAAVVAACGSAASPSAVSSAFPSPTATASTSPATSPDGGVQSPDTSLSGDLTVWAWQEANDRFKLMDETCAKQYPNIRATYVNQADYVKALELGVAAGSGLPDITAIETSQVGRFAERGALADITDRLAPYADQLPAFLWQGLTRDGRNYTVPTAFNPVAVYYNRDLFAQAGIDPASIETWDDYYQAGLTIKEKTGKAMLPLSTEFFASYEAELLETLLWQQDIQFTDPDGKLVLDTDPRVAATLEFIGTKLRSISDDFDSWSDAGWQRVADGDVATVIQPAYWAGAAKHLIGDKGNGKWGIFQLPAWTPGGVRAANFTAEGLSIMSTSQQRDAAWAWIQCHVLQPEAGVKYFTETGIWPALFASADDPALQAPDPWFGNDQVGKVLGQVAKEIPARGPYIANFHAMADLLLPELQKYMAGQETAQEALASAAAQIRTQLGIP